MRGLIQDRPLDVAAVLRRVEQLFGHKRVVTATAAGEVSASWGQVTARARRLAAALDLLGVPRAARIGTFAWNTQRHTELYLAVPVAGRVLHTLNHRLFAEQIRYIVNDAADDVLFVDRSLLPVVWPLVDGFPTVRHVVVMDDGAPHEIPDDPRVLDYEELLSGAPEPGELARNDEDDAASLCYTSGTTGRPKGVLYSHRSIALHALLLLGVDGFAISERDVVMPVVPMFHVNAWGLPYAAMLAGSDLVLPGPAPSPESLIDLMQRHRVTFSSGVATIWRGLVPLLAAADLSHLRMVVSGGGAIPDALSAIWERDAGIVLTNGWGMTETSPVVTCPRVATAHDGLGPDARRLLLGTPGQYLPLTEVRIVSESGAIVERDGSTPGEVQVAGPTIAAGYFGTEPDQADFTEILHDAGIDPAPRRKGPTWRQFLTTQAHGLLALDFVHIDTVLLKRVYALILIEHGTRRVHLLGVSANPDGAWSTQAARNLVMDPGEHANQFKFMIRDRRGQFTSDFDAVLADASIRVNKNPPQAPRANAVCERMIGTLRRELLDRSLIHNETHLRRLLGADQSR